MSLKNNNVEVGKKKTSRAGADDHTLENINLQLKNLEKEFGKTSSEIAEIFCKVSGNVPNMRHYLQHEKNQRDFVAKGGSQISTKSKNNLKGSGVVTWSYLEDLALKKPEESPEFQVLIATKGIDEITTRREFLRVTPQFNQQGNQ